MKICELSYLLCKILICTNVAINSKAWKTRAFLLIPFKPFTHFFCNLAKLHVFLRYSFVSKTIVAQFQVWLISAAQKIKRLSETPETVSIVAKSCVYVAWFLSDAKKSISFWWSCKKYFFLMIMYGGGRQDATWDAREVPRPPLPHHCNALTTPNFTNSVWKTFYPGN